MFERREIETEVRSAAARLVLALLQSDRQGLSQLLEDLGETRAREGRDLAAVGAFESLAVAVQIGLREWPVDEGRHLPSTLKGRVLRSLVAAGGSLPNERLMGETKVDATALSRSCRELGDRGAIVKRKFGRSVTWEITPVGKALAPETAVPDEELGGAVLVDAEFAASRDEGLAFAANVIDALHDIPGSMEGLGTFDGQLPEILEVRSDLHAESASIHLKAGSAPSKGAGDVA